MTKTEFLNRFIKNNEARLPKNLNGTVNKTAASEILDGVFNTITDILAEGDSVQIQGFGTFSTAERKERPGRDLHTGDAIIIPASVQPKFKAGSVLKRAVNGESD